MGVEENVRRALAFSEAYNARDWDALRGTLADTVVLYEPAEPEPRRGPGAIVELLKDFAAGFPTSRIEVVQSVGQGDLVCTENVETGAQKDSDKAYRIHTCYTYKVGDDGLSEIRFYYDALGMMEQMGMPLPGA